MQIIARNKNNTINTNRYSYRCEVVLFTFINKLAFEKRVNDTW